MLSLFGVSFRLKRIISGGRTGGQYCRRDLGRPIKQPDRKEKEPIWLHADRLGFKHPLFLARQDGSSPDIHVPSVHQYFVPVVFSPLLWSMYADCTDYSELKNRGTVPQD